MIADKSLHSSAIVQPLTLLLDGLVDEDLNDSSILINGLATNSQSVQKGNLYLAMQGQQVHGINFLSEAVARGANAVVWEFVENYPLNEYAIPVVPVYELNRKAGIIADRFYSNPSSAVSVIAVTGTNGKSSTTYIASEALSRKYGVCGLLGTLGYGKFGELTESKHTTPETIRLHHEIYNLEQQGVKHVVLEASSHGLAQERLAGVSVNVSVFTMLGRDHYDYHGSKEAYAQSKKRLFELAALEWAILNVDDAFGRELVEICRNHCQVMRYSSHDYHAELMANDIQCHENGIDFKLSYENETAVVNSSLIGRFNVDSLLAASAILITQGISLLEVAELISKAQTVPGRMQKIFTSTNKSSDKICEPQVILDYAHTPDALESVLRSCRDLTKGNLCCVFGCGGERDKGKRPLMGAVAERYADKIILTDDNPRNENPNQIIQDIISGINKRSNVTIEHNRRHAINLAIQNAKSIDWILVAGKGHESYQLIKNTQLVLDDRQLIYESLTTAMTGEMQ